MVCAGSGWLGQAACGRSPLSRSPEPTRSPEFWSPEPRPRLIYCILGIQTRPQGQVYWTDDLRSTPTPRPSSPNQRLLGLQTLYVGKGMFETSAQTVSFFQLWRPKVGRNRASRNLRSSTGFPLDLFNWGTPQDAAERQVPAGFCLVDFFSSLKKKKEIKKKKRENNVIERRPDNGKFVWVSSFFKISNLLILFASG